MASKKEQKTKKSRVKEFFSLNGIPLPVTIENGEYYVNGTRREARKFD
ncbi:MAG: hypothetical protein ACE5KA_04340 [Nitrososphaerales archaeon]